MEPLTDLPSHLQSRKHYLMDCAAVLQLWLDTAPDSSGSCSYTCERAASPQFTAAFLQSTPILAAMQGSWGRPMTQRGAKQPSCCSGHDSPWSLCQSKCSLEALYTCPCCGISSQMCFLWLKIPWSHEHSPVVGALTQMQVNKNPKVLLGSKNSLFIWLCNHSACSCGQSQVQGGLGDDWYATDWNRLLLGCWLHLPCLENLCQSQTQASTTPWPFPLNLRRNVLTCI